MQSLLEYTRGATLADPGGSGYRSGMVAFKTIALPTFSNVFMKEKITWNCVGAAVCLAGAVFFIFRK